VAPRPRDLFVVFYVKFRKIIFGILKILNKSSKKKYFLKHRVFCFFSLVGFVRNKFIIVLP
jgi:hypothetical protein